MADRLEWEVFPCTKFKGDWRVEAIDGESCYVTIFSGPEAEKRAREYAAFKNAKE